MFLNIYAKETQSVDDSSVQKVWVFLLPRRQKRAVKEGASQNHAYIVAGLNCERDFGPQTTYALLVTKAPMLTRSRGQKFLSKKQVFFLRAAAHVILDTILYYQAISTICITAPISQNTFP